MILLLCTAFAAAQTAAAPPPAPTAEDRIRELEDRIIALEGQVRMLQQQATTSQPAAQPAAPAPAQPLETVAATQPSDAAAQQPQLGGAPSMAKALNPDIAVIGNFVATAGHNPIVESPSLAVPETEVSFQAVVDPYARADVYLSFGEEGVDLEEGYLTFTALPRNFVAKVGKMREYFGKVNTMHTHVLPWVDRPLITENLLGGEEGLSDAGFSISRGFAGPKGIYLEATGQMYRGDAGDVWSQSGKRDVSALAHFRGYGDITESTNLDIGFSYGRGHNDLGSDFLTQLYGVDATLRWKPLRRAIYHSFLARSEFVWSDRQQFPARQRAFGFFTSADYQLARRWWMGGRFDWSDRARAAALTDKGGSFVLTYWPSEFAQIRGQYRYTNYAEGRNANELLMQVLFAIGAHGAHPF
ncbi:MAG TPA: hypothetical protein VLA96_09970 [Terriglobales bacterium]|nr:hypothetical protein [Terriglobales bacterium]